MEDKNVVNIFDLYQSTALDNSAVVSSIFDISGLDTLLISVAYETSAGSVDVTYETSLDKITWIAQAAPATLAALTVGNDHVAVTLAVLTKFIRFTATESNVAATVFSARMAIK